MFGITNEVKIFGGSKEDSTIALFYDAKGFFQTFGLRFPLSIEIQKDGTLIYHYSKFPCQAGATSHESSLPSVHFLPNLI